MYAISGEREQDWCHQRRLRTGARRSRRRKRPTGASPADPEYKQRGDSRAPGQILDFLGKRKGLPTGCIDIAPPEKGPGKRAGKNVEDKNRAPVGPGLSVAGLHIQGECIAAPVSFVEPFAYALHSASRSPGSTFEELLVPSRHVLIDRGRMTRHWETGPDSAVAGLKSPLVGNVG